jgi:hypothetical protein
MEEETTRKIVSVREFNRRIGIKVLVEDFDENPQFINQNEQEEEKALSLFVCCCCCLILFCFITF